MADAVSLRNLTGRLLHAVGPPGQDCPITGLTHDSRAVRPGDLFICLEGERHDGHRFAGDALAAGAAALVVQQDGLAAVGFVPPPDTIIVTVPDTRRALAMLACGFYGDPSHQLTLVGVTGTNGKTTTTHMVAAALRASGLRVGTIGTLGASLEGAALDSMHTTPEADRLQALLAEMRRRGAQAVVMEVSSHALAQGRTDGCAFNAVLFTNITRDHLDFHGSMEDYFEAKARLFAEYPVLYPRPDGRPCVSVINVAEWSGRDLVTRARGDILTFTTASNRANLWAEEIMLSAESVRFTACCDVGAGLSRFAVTLPIGGAFQVGNALAAIGAALRLGLSPATIAQGLERMPPVPGRFERVPTGDRGFSVVVDYAHTPDGLENVLRSARALKPRRLLTVFGCGGDRDRTKRPLMGRFAATLSDLAIITSDNPRSEDPDAIIQEILAGIDAGNDPGIRAEVRVEPDRRRAIQAAISCAQEGDLVLIAGKGHEDYQIIGERTLPFDDRLVAQEALNQWNT